MYAKYPKRAIAAITVTMKETVIANAFLTWRSSDTWDNGSDENIFIIYRQLLFAASNLNGYLGAADLST